MLANADAHFYLGLHLRTRSPAQFVTHMTTAIGLGSTEAAMELARHYDVGPADGTADGTADAVASAKALALYSRAAAAGDVRAAAPLARALLRCGEDGTAVRAPQGPPVRRASRSGGRGAWGFERVAIGDRRSGLTAMQRVRDGRLQAKRDSA